MICGSFYEIPPIFEPVHLTSAWKWQIPTPFTGYRRLSRSDIPLQLFWDVDVGHPIIKFLGCANTPVHAEE